MYEEDDYLHGGAGGGMCGGDDEHEENEEIPNEIWQEACWIVISAYFEEKGRQKGVHANWKRCTKGSIAKFIHGLS